jgi:glutamine synthetase
MAHAAALCALSAPTVNCYKRYKLYSFAPTNVTWGHENRTVGWRVKGLKGEGAHIENRVPGGASNPYLVMAGVLAAGLDGLKNKIEPPAETAGIAYGLTGVADLPTRLEKSLEALEADQAMRASLGEEFVKLFLGVKHHEVNKARQNCASFEAASFNDRVDPWEVSEYFEFL